MTQRIDALINLRMNRDTPANRTSIIHSGALLGASLFVMVVAHSLSGEDPVRPVLYSFYVPMIYAMLGYRDADRRGRAAGCTQGHRRFLLENLQILLSGAALVIGISLVDYCRLSEPSLSALVNALQDDVIRLFYMTGAGYDGHGSVGLVCLFGSAVLIRVTYRYIRLMLSHILHAVNAAGMCVVPGLLCVMGVMLARRGIWLPLALDISCVGILFYSLGAACCELREYLRSAEAERDEIAETPCLALDQTISAYHAADRKTADNGMVNSKTTRIYTVIRILLIALCAAYWMHCLGNGDYIEIAIRGYQDVRVIVEAIAAIYVVTQVGNAILCRVPHICGVLSIVGRHPFQFVGFYIVSMYLAFLWNVAGLTISTVLKWVYGTGIIVMIQCVRQSAGAHMDDEDAHLADTIRTWYGRHQQGINLAFYGFYALVLALEILRTTMFTQIMNWTIYDRLYMIGMDGLFAVVLLRFASPLGNPTAGAGSNVGPDGSGRTILRTMLLLTGLMLWNLNGLTALMVLGFLMVGAEGTSARRILQIYLVVSAAEIVIMYWASMHGYIAYLYYAARDAHAMGSIYRTDYAARWFYLLAAYHVLRGQRMRLVEYAIEGCLIYYVFHLTAGKTFLISAPLLLILCYVVNNLPRTWCKWIPGRERLHIVCSWLLALVYPICAIFSYIAVHILGPYYVSIGNPGGTMSTTVHRITLSYEAFLQYPIRLFSQSVTEQGAGGIVNLSEVTYFFLDNSYIRMLIIHGVAFLLIMLAVHIMLMRHAFKEHRYVICCALIAIAVDSISEHHLPAFAYNILPVLLWARWNDLNTDHMEPYTIANSL